MRTGTLLLSHITHFPIVLSHIIPYFSPVQSLKCHLIIFQDLSLWSLPSPVYFCIYHSTQFCSFFTGFPVFPPPPPLQVNHNNIRWFRNLFKKLNIHLSEKRIDRSIDVDLKIYEKSRESNYTSMLPFKFLLQIKSKIYSSFGFGFCLYIGQVESVVLTWTDNSQKEY